MRRTRYQHEEGNEDSFLDVVANVVGVLIILVMIVGAQASRAVLVAESGASTEDNPTAPTDEEEVVPHVDTLRDELQQAAKSARLAERTIQDLATRVRKVSLESQAYDSQRIELATHRAVIQEEIQRRKGELDEQKQREFDVQRQLVETKLDLEKLSKQQLSLISAPKAVTEIECVPTPLAKEVEGQSIHLRLSRGLVSVVPFEELMDEVQYNIEGTLRRLQDRGRAVETFGPLDGYRLKFTIAQRQSLSSLGGPLAGQIQRKKIGWEAEIIPVSEELGQNVERSLLPGGVLHKHLLANQQEKPAVVVWLYTDSFDEFRPLKRAIWEMGFALATRPMKPGENIKASPHGTRAAAQ